MNISKIEKNGVEIAVINSREVLIADVQSALDVMATVNYEVGCDRIVISKSAICEDFFHLRTRLAGDILQKVTNYRMKMAIVGDFSSYASKSFKDFVYESNKGKDVFFVSDTEQALDRLSGC